MTSSLFMVSVLLVVVVQYLISNTAFSAELTQTRPAMHYK